MIAHTTTSMGLGVGCVRSMMMEKESKRALRRHHRMRMIKRAMRKFREWSWNYDEEWVKRSALQSHSHMAVCSCNMCCNERRNPWLTKKEKLTFQERRNLLTFEEEIEEYYRGVV